MPFTPKNYLSEMVWYFIGVYIINRTLHVHGHLEIQNFSAQRMSEIFFLHEKRNSYLYAAMKYPLGIVLPSCLETSWNIDLFQINVTRKNKKYWYKKCTFLWNTCILFSSWSFSEHFIFEADADNLFSSLQCIDRIM